MLEELLTEGTPLHEIAKATIVVLGFGLIAWLAVLILKYIRKMARRQQGLAVFLQVYEKLTGPIVFLLISAGTLQALSSIDQLATWRPYLATMVIALIIVVVTYILARSGSILLASFLKSRVTPKNEPFDEGVIHFLQRMLVIAVFALGLLVLLDFLGQSLTPFLAGLGIGGLAIALALQPTLGNFFAGTQIVSDRVVRVGDYIELENTSLRGYVVDIGWRSTRIRTPFNNLVIIPNSKLAESVITNFYSPAMEVGLTVDGGVSYDSDMARVETIALEVTRQAIRDLAEASKNFEPMFGYERFGESNIDFWIWLQARDRLASFRVKTELMKRLKARFDKEGIRINYPVRQTYLQWSGDTAPPSRS